VGILQHRRTDANSLRIRGLGRGLPFTGAVFLLAALGLAGVPAWGSFLGKSLIESALKAHAGYGWVHVVMTVVEVLVGAAAIAAAARTFLGWGPTLRHDVEQSSQDEGDERDEEISGSPNRTPAVLFGPAVVLLAGSVAIGILPGVGRLALRGRSASRQARRMSQRCCTAMFSPYRPSRPTRRPRSRTCSRASHSRR
jgi:multicomponent Na+:H+ antiporter subunit D